MEKMPTSTAGSSNSQSGFTLVELGIVLLLIGLFAGMTVPMLTGIGEDALKSSARRLAGTVKYLFNEAALDGLEYRLVFDLDRQTVHARRKEANSELVEIEGAGARRRLKGDVRFRDVEVTARGKSTSGEVEIAILPVGWLDETVIHLEDEDKQVLTLRIMPLTGTTEIHEGYREF